MPYVNNNTRTRNLFEGRSDFETQIKQDLTEGYVDLSTNESLYGRVDFNKYPVYPSEAFLRQIKGGNNTLFLENFVAEAFADFWRRLSTLVETNRIAESSFLFSAKPRRAFLNVNSGYHSYLQGIYKAFTESYLTANNLHSKITDFDSFLEQFKNFIESIKSKYVITRTQYTVSKFCSPYISGLLVDLAKDGYDDDENKVEKYLNDSFYGVYEQLAANYGFLIDKSVPWRMEFDLNSSLANDYMNKFGISTKDVFDKQYYLPHRLEIDCLSAYLIGFYNSYVSFKPTVIIPKASIERTATFATPEPETFIQTVSRNPLTKEQAALQYSREWWIGLLAWIYNKERGSRLSDGELQGVLKSTLVIYRNENELKALDFLQKALPMFS